MFAIKINSQLKEKTYKDYDEAFAFIVNALIDDFNCYSTVKGESDWIIQDLKTTIVYTNDNTKIFSYGQKVVQIDDLFIEIIEERTDK